MKSLLFIPKIITSILVITRIKTLDYLNFFFDYYNWSVLKPQIDEIIYVDPSHINLAVTPRLGKGYIKNLHIFDKTIATRYPLGTAQDGDWDINVHDLFTQKSGKRIKILMDIYNSQNEIDKKFYQKELINFLLKNNTSFTIKEANEEVKRAEYIYKSIVKNGFKDHFYQTYNFMSFKFKIKTKSGIRIAIGRNGDIIWIGSHHRMAISKVLKLKSVPALVYYRHTYWQEKRKDFVTNLIEDKKLKIDKNHPDIINIYNHYKK
tara:strand:+ start:460 stop:1248 length:789 start_codon:yes stop_codon:yes gene_type:complete